MELEQNILLVILDKFLIGILIIVIAYWFKKKLEKLKGQLALTTAIAQSRAKAYAELWELTEALSTNNEDPISIERFSVVAKKIKSWYYDNGNAMYLSFEATDLFLKGLPLLDEDPVWRWDEIQSAYSKLRTQLKVDIGCYSKNQAKQQLPTPN